MEFLPFVLIGLPAGVWVDRLRRRPVLIAGDLGRALALASIPLAHALGVPAIASRIWSVRSVEEAVARFLPAPEPFQPEAPEPTPLAAGSHVS